jgi:hypothetical protein
VTPLAARHADLTASDSRCRIGRGTHSVDVLSKNNFIRAVQVEALVGA